MVIKKSCTTRVIYALLLTHIVEKSASGQVYCFIAQYGDFHTLFSHCPLGEMPLPSIVDCLNYGCEVPCCGTLSSSSLGFVWKSHKDTSLWNQKCPDYISHVWVSLFLLKLSLLICHFQASLKWGSPCILGNSENFICDHIFIHVMKKADGN